MCTGDLVGVMSVVDGLGLDVVMLGLVGGTGWVVTLDVVVTLSGIWQERRKARPKEGREHELQRRTGGGGWGG